MWGDQVKEKELRRGRVGKWKGERLHWICSLETLLPFQVEVLGKLYLELRLDGHLLQVVPSGLISF